MRRVDTTSFDHGIGEQVLVAEHLGLAFKLLSKGWGRQLAFLCLLVLGQSEAEIELLRRLRL